MCMYASAHSKFWIKPNEKNQQIAYGTKYKVNRQTTHHMQKAEVVTNNNQFSFVVKRE